MKRAPTFTLSLLSLLAVLSAGCGQATDSNRPETFSVSGTVTQDGQPLEGATVSFHAADGSAGAVGITDASGNYTLTTFSAGDGAVAGDHKVTITKTDRPVIEAKSDGSVADTGDEPEEQQGTQSSERGGGPKNLLPEKYASPDTSGLTATVAESGENKFDFQVD